VWAPVRSWPNGAGLLDQPSEKKALTPGGLLVQHFGDVDFHEQCLALLLELRPPERDLKHYAFTFDLLCKVKGELPRFGTMGLPVADVEDLDELRAQFDLPPLESQETSGAAGVVVLPAEIGRHTRLRMAADSLSRTELRRYRVKTARRMYPRVRRMPERRLSTGR
jgi:hypothetical protein